MLSPRKALRKRAPKRKRAAEQAAAQQAEAISGGSFSELLNQPINQRAFEQLLAGDWQVMMCFPCSQLGALCEGPAGALHAYSAGAQQLHDE